MCIHAPSSSISGKIFIWTINWQDNKSKAQETHSVRHIYVMTGANPNTEWLQGGVALDDKGFILTGSTLTKPLLRKARWPLRRDTYVMETTILGVFAAGDVRSGSVKRVAAGVSEGALAVSCLHRLLEANQDRLNVFNDRAR